jgi:pyridoxamine 5'-phosphate oxidase
MEKDNSRDRSNLIIVFRGGYLIEPIEFEFWQGNDIRLHDRIRFRKPKPDEKLDASLHIQGENGWIIERLAP